MTSLRRCFSLSILACCASILAGIAEAADYYVDSHGGDNARAGTEPAQAWRDFTPLNSRTFATGDRILLASGSLWDQALDLHGSGTATAPIVLTSYGPGPRPHIARRSALTDRTITLDNPSHWIIRNLELSHANLGVEVNYTGFGHEDLTLDHLYIHDIDLDVDGLPCGSGSVFYSAGILISFRPELPNPSQFALAGTTGIFNAETPPIPIPTPSEFTLSGLTISNCEIARTTAPIVLGTSFVVGNYSPYSFRKVLIKDNNIHDARGPINTAFITEGLWLNNIVTRVGTNPLLQGTTAIFVSNTTGLRFINNWISHVPDTGSPDQSAIDFEAFNARPEVRGNFISDTAGVALELLFVDDGIFQNKEANYNTNVAITGNVFLRNTLTREGSSWGLAVLGTASGRKKDPYNQTATVSNNLISEQREGDVLLGGNLSTPGSWDNSTQLNNLEASVHELTNAAVAFSKTPGANNWTAKSYAGTQWAPLTYDDVNSRWGTESASVSRFNLLPPPGRGSGIARVWTAPHEGTICVRGRVLKDDVSTGDGVQVEIKQNDKVIWPADGTARTIQGNDRSGCDTNLDGVEVKKDDQIYFVVSTQNPEGNTGDLTSWIPTLAYTNKR